jgi:hypothetical protein
MHVTSTLISLLPADEQAHIQNFRPNAADPPDILFEMNDKTVGIELAELVPSNRHGKDAILDNVRSRILELLVLGEHTKNRVVFLHPVDPYSEQLKLKDCAQAVATLLNTELKGRSDRSFVLTLPAELQQRFRSICIETYDLSGHFQVSNDSQPLIVFSAEATFIVPEEDFPKILSNTVGRKLQHDLVHETWLLIWTDNQAMSGVREELHAHAKKFLATRNCRYRRVFLATFGFKNEVTE